MFKLTIEEHYEGDWQLIEAKFSLLGQTKSVYFFATPCVL